MAQLVQHLPRMQMITGSRPARGSSSFSLEKKRVVYECRCLHFPVSITDCSCTYKTIVRPLRAPEWGHYTCTSVSHMIMHLVTSFVPFPSLSLSLSLSLSPSSLPPPFLLPPLPPSFLPSLYLPPSPILGLLTPPHELGPGAEHCKTLRLRVPSRRSIAQRGGGGSQVRLISTGGGGGRDGGECEGACVRV